MTMAFKQTILCFVFQLRMNVSLQVYANIWITSSEFNNQTFLQSMQCINPYSNLCQVLILILKYMLLQLLVDLVIPGRVAQSVTCLATDACLTADPGVASSIPARSHTFVEIDHEIISTVILLPSADSFKKGCCQLQAKVCAQITG